MNQMGQPVPCMPSGARNIRRWQKLFFLSAGYSSPAIGFAVSSVLTVYAAYCLRYKRFGVSLAQLSRTVRDHAPQAYKKRAEDRANRR